MSDAARGGSAPGAARVEVICDGPFETNGYVVSDPRTAACLVIDVPIGAAERVAAAIMEQRLHPEAIILTHGHFDHVGDTAALAARLDVPVCLHADDAALAADPMRFFAGLGLTVAGVRPDRLLAHGDVVSCGALRFEILHCPGHTPGHICLLEPAAGLLFTGDVLFRGSIGRTDLPGGDHETLMTSIISVLLSLPDQVRAHPGHGPATSIGAERAENPFIREWLEHF